MRKVGLALSSVLLAVLVGYQALAQDAEATFNPEGYPIVDEPITLSIMGARHPLVGPWEETLFFQKMEELTNINFEYRAIPLEGFDERKNLTFASGDVPDVFFGALLIPGEEVDYGGQGVLIPLEDLIEQYAPNIQAMFEANPEVRNSIITPDGHIYALPYINQASIAVLSPMWVNGDWLDALGITELPQTTDELYELLVAFKDQDPNGNGEADEIPMTSVALNDVRIPLLAAFGHLAPGIEVKDDEVIFAPIEEGYREYLAYANKLYSEGLLDNETFAQDSQQVVAKGYDNRVGMTVAAIPPLIWDVPWDVPVNSSDLPAFYPVLPALTSPANDEKVYPIGTGIVRGTFAITNTNPHPEATIRWVDYLYSLEGSILPHYGPEGVFWDWADRSKGLRKNNEPPEGMSIEEWRGTLTPSVGIPLPWWVRPEVERGWDSAGHQFRFADMEEKLLPYGQVALPDVYLTREEQQSVSVIMSDLQPYIEQAEARFVTGQESLEGWDNYVGTIQGMGIDELIQIYQDAYDRWASAN